MTMSSEVSTDVDGTAIGTTTPKDSAHLLDEDASHYSPFGINAFMAKDRFDREMNNFMAESKKYEDDAISGDDISDDPYGDIDFGEDFDDGDDDDDDDDDEDFGHLDNVDEEDIEEHVAKSCTYKSRTSQILNEYQNYVNQMEMDGESSSEIELSIRSGKSDGTALSDVGFLANKQKEPEGFRDFPDEPWRHSITIVRGEAPDKNTNLRRGWSHDGRIYGETYDVIDETDANNDGWMDQTKYLTSNIRSLMYSKTFKRNILGLVVLCVLTGAVVGLLGSSGGGNSNESDVPQLEEGQKTLPHHDIAPEVDKKLQSPTHEAAETNTSVEGAESGSSSTNESKDSNPDIQEPDTSSKEAEDTQQPSAQNEVDNTSSSNSESNQDETPSDNSGAENEESVASTATKATTPNSVAATIDPVAFEYVESTFKPAWFDRSHDWTGTTYFEALQFCASRESRIPCPLEAICPMGPHSAPFEGHREGYESWSPTISSPNEWVLVSSAEDSCVTYTSIHKAPPSWGLSGEDSREHTNHVACCIDRYDSKSSTDINKESQHVGIVAVTPKEKDSLKKYHPIWFGREHGYSGTTYDNAAEFCRNVGNLALCPIEAYCPDGAMGDGNPMFLAEFPFEGEQWAPTHKSNEWVQVGVRTDNQPAKTCSTYAQVNKEPPAWGLDGTNTEMKKHVMCCIKEESSISREEAFDTGLDPIWLDNDHGWHGGSHDDAIAFCDGLERKLCPISAYCPLGPGQPPIGGHISYFDSEGEQWAPFSSSGFSSQWVMIGQKYGNSMTTCMTHEELEGSGQPDWDSSTEGAFMKKHIMCCLF